jgi:hypothetical protein
MSYDARCSSGQDSVLLETALKRSQASGGHAAHVQFWTESGLWDGVWRLLDGRFLTVAVLMRYTVRVR